MPNERSRRWQLTENNPTYTKQEGANLFASIGEATYVVASCEIGESGTKHIHIFAIFKNAISLSSIKRHFPRAHLEACIGSNADNKAYVVKDDGDYYESGEMPVATGTTRGNVDIAHEVVNLLMSGVSLEELLTEYPPYTSYVVANYRNLCQIARDFGRNMSKRRR